MNKKIYLSLACVVAINASAQDLGQIDVVEKVNSTVFKNISAEDIKSADLAEALAKKSPNISLVRRSGIANDIILRGQKKDNINILIGAAKIYGACPNRMDPPTSHVSTNNIEEIKIIEGPYDVENFGTLSGLVDIKTKEPAKELAGEVNLNMGSFGYKKASATISGGTDKVKLLLSTSIEKGDQYEDGDGDDFTKQQIKQNVPKGNQYLNDDEEAYEKKTLLGKAIININDDSELNFSYTANRSDTILYAAGSMDADYDDSDIYTVGYTARNLGDASKELNIDYYYSEVDHPMSTKLRNGGATNYMTNHLETSIWGAKIQNSLEVADSLVTIGLDTSVRNWEGQMSKTTVASGMVMDMDYKNRMYSTDTTNKALFSKVEKSFGKLDLEVGMRYDTTDIETERKNVDNKEYNSFNGYLFGTYNIDETSKFFAGIGKSSRVPDARELYQLGSGSTMSEVDSINAASSNQNLDQTKNYEADIGYQTVIGNFSFKTKAFYSELKDYIYNTGTFENIDAKIYGLDISGAYLATDSLSFDYGVAYQRGKKDGSHTDKDLAEVTPLKANLAVNYEFTNSKFTTEVVAVDRWDNYDSSAKEQELAGYALVNLKYSHQLHENFGFTIGVDNLFDTTYASTNTYQDVNYVKVNSDQVLFNDMGRYGYVNLKYSF